MLLRSRDDWLLLQVTLYTRFSCCVKLYRAMMCSVDDALAGRATSAAAWVRLVAVVELLPGVLDSQLRRDADLTHFEYFVLAMLSEAPERTLRMTALAAQTNATLPRLSHVVHRLEDRGLVERFPCPEDGRATNARLTAAGLDARSSPPRPDTSRPCAHTSSTP